MSTNCTHVVPGRDSAKGQSRDMSYEDPLSPGGLKAELKND